MPDQGCTMLALEGQYLSLPCKTGKFPVSIQEQKKFQVWQVPSEGKQIQSRSVSLKTKLKSCKSGLKKYHQFQDKDIKTYVRPQDKVKKLPIKPQEKANKTKTPRPRLIQKVSSQTTIRKQQGQIQNHQVPAQLLKQTKRNNPKSLLNTTKMIKLLKQVRLF